MVTLNEIRELILKQDKELEKMLFEYFSEKNIEKNTNDEIIHDKNSEKEDIKNKIEKSLSEDDIENSKILLKKYKEIAQNDVSVYCIEGIIYMNENNLEKAFECFSEGLEIYRTNVDLLYNMGYLSSVIGDLDLSIYYYNESIKYTDDLELINEIEFILNNLQNISKTIITIDLEPNEARLFHGNTKIISIIRNENLEYEHKYEENNMTIYEVSSNKLNGLIEYLLKMNNDSIIVFKDIFKSEIIKKFRGHCKIAYYVNENYYTEKINYYTNSIKLFLEKFICDNIDYIFTDNIKIYNYKKIIEKRKNIYLIDKTINEMLSIDSILESKLDVYIEDVNNILKKYLSKIDEEYKKSFYLLASECNNIENCLQVSKYIYEKYNSKEMYHIYMSILNENYNYVEAVYTALNSEYCDEHFKAELVFLNSIECFDLISFMIDLSIKNYTMVDNKLNEENIIYKISAYNFEINKTDTALDKYTELINHKSELNNSPIVNRNIFHLLYLLGDKNYEKYEKKYNEMLDVILNYNK